MNDQDYMKLALRTESTPDFVFAQTLESDEIDLSRAMHGSIGLCTEVGELQDAIKKHLIYGKKLDKVNIIEECGDVLWYLALVLDSVGSDLTDAKERNIRKLSVRFPEKFTQDQALVRDLDAERAELERQEGEDLEVEQRSTNSHNKIKRKISIARILNQVEFNKSRTLRSRISELDTYISVFKKGINRLDSASG